MDIILPGTDTDGKSDTLKTQHFIILGQILDKVPFNSTQTDNQLPSQKYAIKH